jgi:hypothetical protein
VDQAHVKIAHRCAVLRFVKQGVLAVKDRLFDRLFTMSSLLPLFIMDDRLVPGAFC